MQPVLQNLYQSGNLIVAQTFPWHLDHLERLPSVVHLSILLILIQQLQASHHQQHQIHHHKAAKRPEVLVWLRKAEKDSMLNLTSGIMGHALLVVPSA